MLSQALDEIVSIEECGEEETIDITTDGNHVFFANKILTHNSGYDTSEVTMASTSESAGINHVVDFLGALWQQDGDREANKLSMTVLKNRLGGMIGQTKEFFINYSTLRITDMEREVKDETKSEIDEILGDINQV